MNMDALSYVKFGDKEGLAEMLWENGVQHRLSSILVIDNPFQLLDVDWNVEDDFYDWLGVHLTVHQQIAAALGV